MEGFLIALATLAAVANLVYGSILVWGLAGGDGEGSVVGGVLGLALFGVLVWVSIQTMSLLEPVFRAAMIGFLVIGAGVAMYVLGATDDRWRRRFMGIAVGSAALVVAVVVGIGGGGSIDAWRPVLIALLPPLLLAIAVIVVDIDFTEGDGRFPGIVAAILAIPAILLTLAQIL